MSILRNLDSRNNYNPDLKNIKESAERTYGEANAFFEMVENYLKFIEEKYNSFTEKDIYDKSNAIASDLAKCCELYLKALYIYENNIENNNIEDIWKKLKSSAYKIDKNGNYVYLLEKNNKEKVYTYVKVDNNGNKVLDSNGNTIYVDEMNNTYLEGQQGKKIKLNGHQLDRLIDKLSNDSRILLELRMSSIPMSNTEMYDEISVYDELKKNGIIFNDTIMSKYEYLNWVDQHKKTFEETRYAGQAKHNINLEFLYHLTKQIKAVVHYKLKSNQQSYTKEEFNDYNLNQQLLKELENNIWHDWITDENKYTSIELSEEEFLKIPKDLQNEILSLSFFNLLSLELIDKLLNDSKVKKRFYNLRKKGYLVEMTAKTLYLLLNDFDDDEIDYLMDIFSSLNIRKYSYDFKLLPTNNKYTKENIIKAFNLLNFSINDVINYSIYLKKKYNYKINNNVFLHFIDYMDYFNYYYHQLDNEVNKGLNNKKLK